VVKETLGTRDKDEPRRIEIRRSLLNESEHGRPQVYRVTKRASAACAALSVARLRIEGSGTMKSSQYQP